MSRLRCLPLLLALPLCVARAQEPVLQPVPADALPAFGADDLDKASLRAAIHEELRLQRARADRALSLGGIATTRSDLILTLERLDGLLDLPASDLAAAVSSGFACYRSVGGDGQGTVLFTGYHSPCYEGSRERTERYRWPVLRAPPELAGPAFREQPFLTRREIQGEGKLDGRGLEIVWLADRLDGFLLEVQGSGSARLPDGSLVRLQCTRGNGHGYTSLGKELVKAGKIPLEQAGIPAIRAYFREHPEDMDEFLFKNESYVFFEESDRPPTGCAGAAVTAMRSIATDKRFFPPGAVAFVVVEIPVCQDGQVVGWEKRARFVIDQDTGGAIRGPGRVDIYMGADPDAEAAAGVMKRDGALYYLLARSAD